MACAAADRVGCRPRAHPGLGLAAVREEASRQRQRGIVNGGRVLGPAVAGVLIAKVGTTPCVGLNALSYLAAVVALVMIPSLPETDRSRLA